MTAFCVNSFSSGWKGNCFQLRDTTHLCGYQQQTVVTRPKLQMTYSPYSVTNDKSGGHIVPGTFSRFEFLEGRVTGPSVLNPSLLDFTVPSVSDAAFGEWRALSASTRAKELEKRRSITKATLESLRKPASEMEKLTSLGQYNEVYRRTLKIFNDPSDGVGALDFIEK